MRRRNVIAALVLIVFSVGYGVLTADLPERSLPNTPGPPFFPWINTVILMTLSLALLASGVFGRVEESVVGSGRAARLRGTAVIGLFFGYLLILPGFGFILATIPFFGLLMMVFGEKRVLPVAAGSLGVTVCLYILFRHGFGVFLPAGVLGDLLGGVLA